MSAYYMAQHKWLDWVRWICRSLLRSYAHDDVTTGSWFIGLDVTYIDEGKFCCSSWSAGPISPSSNKSKSEMFKNHNFNTNTKNKNSAVSWFLLFSLFRSYLCRCVIGLLEDSWWEGEIQAWREHRTSLYLFDVLVCVARWKKIYLRTLPSDSYALTTNSRETDQRINSLHFARCATQIH